jgi:type IV fimbrial biogenesis protein FimT
MSKMQKYCKGVTLIELIVVLTIVGILTMMGAPSFNDAIRTTRLATSVNELVTSLSLARNEAIKRNRRVIVQRTGANWENGWQVFVDIDGSDTFNDNGNATLCEPNIEDCLLQVHDALSGFYTLRFKGFTNDNLIRYTPSGTINNNNGTFYLCDNSDGNNIPEPNTAKLVIINTIGRPRTGLDDNNNGIPEKVSGTDITTCTP